MWYPVRLEVATLVGEPSSHDTPLAPTAPASTLPPVAGSPVHNAPVFVIGAESVNKRPKTAGQTTVSWLLVYCMSNSILDIS